MSFQGWPPGIRDEAMAAGGQFPQANSEQHAQQQPQQQQGAYPQMGGPSQLQHSNVQHLMLSNDGTNAYQGPRGNSTVPVFRLSQQLSSSLPAQQPHGGHQGQPNSYHPNPNYIPGDFGLNTPWEQPYEPNSWLHMYHEHVAAHHQAVYQSALQFDQAAAMRDHHAYAGVHQQVNLTPRLSYDPLQNAWCWTQSHTVQQTVHQPISDNVVAPGSYTQQQLGGWGVQDNGGERGSVSEAGSWLPPEVVESAIVPPYVQDNHVAWQREGRLDHHQQPLHPPRTPLSARDARYVGATPNQHPHNGQYQFHGNAPGFSDGFVQPATQQQHVLNHVNPAVWGNQISYDMNAIGSQALPNAAPGAQHPLQPAHIVWSPPQSPGGAVHGPGNPRIMYGFQSPPNNPNNVWVYMSSNQRPESQSQGARQPQQLQGGQSMNHQQAYAAENHMQFPVQTHHSPYQRGDGHHVMGSHQHNGILLNPPGLPSPDEQSRREVQFWNQGYVQQWADRHFPADGQHGASFQGAGVQDHGRVPMVPNVQNHVALRNHNGYCPHGTAVHGSMNNAQHWDNQLHHNQPHEFHGHTIDVAEHGPYSTAFEGRGGQLRPHAPVFVMPTCAAAMAVNCCSTQARAEAQPPPYSEAVRPVEPFVLPPRRAIRAFIRGQPPSSSSTTTTSSDLPPCNVSSSSITNTPPPPYNSIDRHEVLESNTSGYSVHGAASVQDLSAMRQASEAWEGQGVVVGRRVRTRRRRNLFTIPPYYPRSPRRIAGVSSVPAGLGQPPPYSSRAGGGQEVMEDTNWSSNTTASSSNGDQVAIPQRLLGVAHVHHSVRASRGYPGPGSSYHQHRPDGIVLIDEYGRARNPLSRCDYFDNLTLEQQMLGANNTRRVRPIAVGVINMCRELQNQYGYSRLPASTRPQSRGLPQLAPCGAPVVISSVHRPTSPVPSPGSASATDVISSLASPLYVAVPQVVSTPMGNGYGNCAGGGGPNRISMTPVRVDPTPLKLTLPPCPLIPPKPPQPKKLYRVWMEGINRKTTELMMWIYFTAHYGNVQSVKIIRRPRVVTANTVNDHEDLAQHSFDDQVSAGSSTDGGPWNPDEIDLSQEKFDTLHVGFVEFGDEEVANRVVRDLGGLAFRVRLASEPPLDPLTVHFHNLPPHKPGEELCKMVVAEALKTLLAMGGAEAAGIRPDSVDEAMFQFKVFTCIQPGTLYGRLNSKLAALMLIRASHGRPLPGMNRAMQVRYAFRFSQRVAADLLQSNPIDVLFNYGYNIEELERPTIGNNFCWMTMPCGYDTAYAQAQLRKVLWVPNTLTGDPGVCFVPILLYDDRPPLVGVPNEDHCTFVGAAFDGFVQADFLPPVLEFDVTGATVPLVSHPTFEKLVAPTCPSDDEDN